MLCGLFGIGAVARRRKGQVASMLNPRQSLPQFLDRALCGGFFLSERVI